MGNKKILYETETLALKEATEYAEKYNMEFKVYPCPVNKGWHLSTKLNFNKFVEVKRFRRYDKTKMRVLFFDLEFYVPENDRNIKGIRANPYKDGHFLIGGTFIFFNPLSEDENAIDIFRHWIWDYENEKTMIKAILENIIHSIDEKEIRNLLENTVICGNGISTLDIPYLFGRCQKCNINLDANLYYWLNGFKIVDLQNVVIPFFKYDDSLLYPISKEEMNNLFLNKLGKNEMKKLIWDYYDENEYNSIMKNNEDEVLYNLEIYKMIIKYDNTIRIIRKKYLKDTFEKLIGFIGDEDDKNLVLDNYYINNSNTYYLLNNINIDSDPNYILNNMALLNRLITILETAHVLSTREKLNGN